jgi:uncharacterized protein (TIGR02996 family)
VKELLAEIVANPADDGPRRVYADALLERDDPYGEFINVQLDLAGEGLSRAERIQRRIRESELLGIHRRTWIAPLDRFFVEPRFRRGFVDEAIVAAQVLARESSELLGVAPLLRIVKSDIAEDSPASAFARLEEILASRVVEQLEGLVMPIGHYVDREEREVRPIDEAAVHLAEAGERLPRLVAFGSSWVRDEAALARFVRAPLLRRLRWIDLSTQYTSARAILDAIPRGQLRGVRWDTSWDDRLLDEPLHSLSFHVHGKTKVAYDIGRAPALANLHELGLGNSTFESLELLAEPKHLDALRILRFYGPLTPGQLRRMVKSPLVQRLDVLDLRGTKKVDHADLARLFDGILLTGDRVTITALGECW